MSKTKNEERVLAFSKLSTRISMNFATIFQDRSPFCNVKAICAETFFKLHQRFVEIHNVFFFGATVPPRHVFFPFLLRRDALQGQFRKGRVDEYSVDVCPNPRRLADETSWLAKKPKQLCRPVGHQLLVRRSAECGRLAYIAA